MGATGCPRCGSVVALHEGRPFVTTSGAIELWHRACWDEREVAVIIDSPPPELRASAPRQRRRLLIRDRRWSAAAIATTLVLGTGVVRWALRSERDGDVGLVSMADAATSSDLHQSIVAREITPPPRHEIETPLTTRYAVPRLHNRRLDAVFPSLDGWIHPVTGSPELMPEQSSRHFGAVRVGIERIECGSGHCGVDLDGPRGRPIVSVADGVVVRVEHSELGRDGRSGRYVRIQHDDGTLTAYMHLDAIAPDLEVGDRISAGAYVGTLGATAVFSAAPHLHFSLEVPNHPGDRGDLTDTHYVDPAPFLVRATIAPIPDRRHARKPAM